MALYTLLERLAPNPVTTLNRAVALGMVSGPKAGLALVSELETGVLAGSHRLLAVRAHLLERSGQTAAAAAAYQEAAHVAGSLPEQRFLLKRAANCCPDPRSRPACRKPPASSDLSVSGSDRNAAEPDRRSMQ